MRILLVGSGGREHALAWKLAQEAEVHCAPGNPGIAEDCTVHDVPSTDIDCLVGLADGLAVDLVVIGPEGPLVEGLADVLASKRIPVYGPGREGANLEGSKAFSKEMMRVAGVPTAASGSFEDPAQAREYARSFFGAGRQAVVKASGNALGKGVSVCETIAEADEAIGRMMVEREFGDAGSTVVVEERLRGREFSLLTLCSDNDFWSLPVAQDFKRVGEGDTGPNTGGMGSVSPVSWVDAELVERTEFEIVRPMLAALNRRGIGFRGTLFSGVMVQDGKPYCLEYNVRFGDPETQSVMLRLGTGFAEALLACAVGGPIPSVEVLDRAAVSVVVASGGYPGPYSKGKTIEIGPIPPNAKLFHAGTTLSEGKLVTAGGRVIACSAFGASVAQARDMAFAAASSVKFNGAFYREDIAGSAS